MRRIDITQYLGAKQSVLNTVLTVPLTKYTQYTPHSSPPSPVDLITVRLGRIQDTGYRIQDSEYNSELYWFFSSSLLVLRAGEESEGQRGCVFAINA